MTTTTIQSVQQLYVAYFGRPAEPGGLTYWVNALSNGATLSDISNAFSQTVEYKAAFAGMSNDAIITQIYQNLFNRVPDAGGLAYWSGHLLDGSLSVSHIVEDISSSAINNPGASGSDTTAIIDKIAAASAFTDLLNSNATLRLAYSTPAAAQIAKDFLHGVSDDASLAAAKTALPTTVSSALTTPATPPSQPVVATALTTGHDTLVGTAGNDTFTSAATDSSHQAVTTLNAGDSIDGGAGTDTFNLVATETTNTHLVGTVKNVETINITGSDFIDVDGISARGTIAADFFVGARTIAVDGAYTDINNVAAGEKIAFTSHGIHDRVNYLDGVTSAAIGLTGVAGTITVSGAALTTLTVSGSTNTEIFGLAHTLVAESDPHLLRLIDVDNSVATLNVALTNNSTVDVSDMSALTKFDASTSSGGITLDDDLSGHLAIIKTGAGSDTIDIDGIVTSALAVSTGAGADVINLHNAITAGETIDGGAGIDTLNLSVVDDGTVLGGSVTNVEVINVTGSDFVSGGINTILFAGAQTFIVDGVNTGFHNVATGQEAVFTGHGINTSLDYNNNVVSATIGLTNASGAFFVDGNALTTLTVTGSTYVPPVLQSLVVNDAPPTLTLNGDDSPIATLNLSLSNDAQVDVSGLGALVTVNASASTGGIDFLGTLGTTVTTVQTGAGADFVELNTIFTGAVTHATVGTGAGNDTIDINVSSSTINVSGTYAIDAGAGNDSIIVSTGLVTGDTINGGLGADTVVLTQISGNLTSGTYTLINGAISNVETLEFASNVNADASQLSHFSSLTLDLSSNVTGATDAQTLVAHGDLAASAAGYVAADGVDPATYAGSVNVTTDGSHTITVNGASAAVTVNTASDGDVDAIINGDLHTGLTVHVNNSTDSSDLASASITVNTAHESSGAGDAAVAASLASLTSITLTGSGAVTLDNSNSIGGGAATALTTIDASQLGGLHAQTGAVTEGLTFTGNLNVAENITLGAGTDHINVASTVALLDTITGFDAVKETADNTSTVDTLDFGGLHIDGSADAASHIASLGEESGLNDAFAAAAAASFTNAVNGVGAIETFTFNGATYLYQNLGADDGSHATDLAVKLVGTIDLAQAYGVHQLPL